MNKNEEGKKVHFFQSFYSKLINLSENGYFIYTDYNKS